jgi:hypothetical protein
LALFIKFFTALAHPADLFRRIAYHEGVVGYVLRDHCPGADECVAADGVAADDGAVCPQGGALLDEGGVGADECYVRS